MFKITNFIFLFCLQYVCIECFGRQNLSVRYVDQKLIEKQRQANLEICRKFNEENFRLSKPNSLYERQEKSVIPKTRSKREVPLPVDPLPNGIDEKEAKRVEDIVDKLYDDLADKGESVTYRRRQFEDKQTTTELPIGRRFYFAPGEMLGPTDADKPTESRDVNKTGGYEFYPWPKKWKHGIVPYFIDTKCYDEELSELILKAFGYFEKATCIRMQRLRERPTDSQSLQGVEWLYITNPSGIRQCVHSNEQLENKGVQMVVFGYGCMKQGEILHEIMHVLGFSHEHTRPDRDEHITILWDNIKPGYKKFFEVRKEDPLMNLPYDFSSVLHYPPKAFSKNGQQTILTQTGVNIGQRALLSATDIEKVGIVFGYECTNRDREYLHQTCPTVVKSKPPPKFIVEEDKIKQYFESRLWPFGIVTYEFRDPIEFSIEERENIRSVMRHIEKETCLKFQDVSNIDGNLDKDENTVEEKIGVPSDESVGNLKDITLKMLKHEVIKKIKDSLSNKTEESNEENNINYMYVVDTVTNTQSENLTVTLAEPTTNKTNLLGALKQYIRSFVQKYMPNFDSKILQPLLSKITEMLQTLKYNFNEVKRKILEFFQSKFKKNKNTLSNTKIPGFSVEILTETENTNVKHTKSKLFFGFSGRGFSSLGEALKEKAESALNFIKSIPDNASNVSGIISNKIKETVEDIAAQIVASTIFNEQEKEAQENEFTEIDDLNENYEQDEIIVNDEQDGSNENVGNGKKTIMKLQGKNRFPHLKKYFYENQMVNTIEAELIREVENGLERHNKTSSEDYNDVNLSAQYNKTVKPYVDITTNDEKDIIKLKSLKPLTNIKISMLKFIIKMILKSVLKKILPFKIPISKLSAKEINIMEPEKKIEIKEKLNTYVEMEVDDILRQNNVLKNDIQVKIMEESGKMANKNYNLFSGFQIKGLMSIAKVLKAAISSAYKGARKILDEVIKGDAGIVISLQDKTKKGFKETIFDRLKDFIIEKAVGAVVGLTTGTNPTRKNGRLDVNVVDADMQVPSRRHAGNILTLVRSANPGCKCPKPGRPEGKEVLEINADCFNSVNDLLHHFVHVLGLDHQHNMHDRDDYLNILWDKLTPEISSEMKKKLPPAASAGFPYDYQSVMHYPWLEIKDGVTQIMYPVWDDGWSIGHWQGLSTTDVNKLNKIYTKECQKRIQQSNNDFISESDENTSA